MKRKDLYKVYLVPLISVLVGAALGYQGTILHSNKQADSAYLTMLAVTNETLQVECNHTISAQVQIKEGSKPMFELLGSPATDTLVRSHSFHTRASPTGKKALLLLSYQISYFPTVCTYLGELSPNESLAILDIYLEYLEEVGDLVRLEREFKEGRVTREKYNATINEGPGHVRITNEGEIFVDYVTREALEEGMLRVFEEAIRL